jgi:FkbM family methyltransferase
MTIYNYINSFLSLFKIQLIRYPSSDIKRRLLLLNYYNIDLIVDVGANKGDYTSELLKLGFNSSIISFEPIHSIFLQLETKSKKYPNWEVFNYAIGNYDGESFINVTNNINSSSLMEILDSHLNYCPESFIVRKEKIIVKKIDTFFNSFINYKKNVFLKIDVQGFEMLVLEGAKDSLDKIIGIQLEMTIDPLFQGGPLYQEMFDYIVKKGFFLHSIENGFSDQLSGKLVQFDAIFFKSHNLK